MDIRGFGKEGCRLVGTETRRHWSAVNISTIKQQHAEPETRCSKGKK